MQRWKQLENEKREKQAQNPALMHKLAIYTASINKVQREQKLADRLASYSSYGVVSPIL